MRILRVFSNSKRDIPLQNAKMSYRENHLLAVDILIRTVKWKRFNHIPKVLIQIIPTNYISLLKIA